MLPDFKKRSDVGERRQLGQIYLHKKEQLAQDGNSDAPSEASVEFHA
jgi:hypothetical protein